VTRDLSAVPLDQCECGGNHQTKGTSIKHECQICRKLVPCREWSPRLMRWACWSCRTNKTKSAFKPGDLVRFPFDLHWDYHGTVYTVAGIWPGPHAWVQLREYANPVQSESLRLATDATEPSKRFPPPLPNPDWNAKHTRLIEHWLDGGGYVQHWEDDHVGEYGRLWCPVCKQPEQSRLL